MPWQKVEPMSEKERFVNLALTGRFTISKLCEDFGISRKTGHKYIARFKHEGPQGLNERSRRPKNSPSATEAEIERLVVKERRKHPTWGPKKIRDLLGKIHGIENPPHCSTIGSILSRYGLSQKRKRKPGVHRVHPEHLTQATRPNEVWTFDFKGWFLLGNQQRCEPLTVCDRYSHYVIACRAQQNQQFQGTLRACKKLMRYYGLPEIIRVDNGTPFASVALGGLSLLSIWWIEQGIQVEFITPGKPQQNGSHERMHRDLKAEATVPASSNMQAQQKRFDRWRNQYNHERPHESLDMLRPGEIYRPSSRRLGEKDKMGYPSEYQTKRVSQSGHISYEGCNFYLSEIYAGCKVGLKINEEGITELHYANLHLGNLEFNNVDSWRPKEIIVSPKQQIRSSGALEEKA